MLRRERRLGKNWDYSFVKRSSAASFYDVGTNCVTAVMILVIVITMIIIAKVQLGCRKDAKCLIS